MGANVQDNPDKSNGYEAIADDFVHARIARIGPSVVREWCESLALGSTVLELGCGFGAISEVIVNTGLSLYAIDASKKLLRVFCQRFPDVPTECAAVEDSSYFSRTFDAVVAWGLMFLLPVDVQKIVIAKAAKALVPGGQLLFTATENEARWNDGMTGLPSHSLGAERYDALLTAQGLIVTGHATDEGDNYYFFASKSMTPDLVTRVGPDS